MEEDVLQLFGSLPGTISDTAKCIRLLESHGITRADSV